MSFAPILPGGGYVGWSFLKRTMTTQKAAFEVASNVKRDDTYFREKIGSIDTAEALVADKRLLRVALGAFGLDADINSGFFIQKVLNDGTLSEDALANRLADKQYLAFSAAFGFGDFAVPRTKISDFADKILANYKIRQFETAVGEQNDGLRLALNAERELASIALKTTSENVKWFTIMGSPPLRQVFETALGLPGSFAAIDLDQQLTTLKDKTQRLFGDDGVSQFAAPDKLDKLLRHFLVRSDVAAGAAAISSSTGALQMLRSGQQSLAMVIQSMRG